MRAASILVATALAAAATALAQEAPPPPAPERRVPPPGLMAMRLGTPRSALPDTMPCATDAAGEEWCSRFPYQRVQLRDSVVVAVEVLINFQAPDSLTADTVWVRYALPRANRQFGTPDSLTADTVRTRLWWNWDGARGPRRARVEWVRDAPSPPGGTLVATRFLIQCSPTATLEDCKAVPQRP